MVTSGTGAYRREKRPLSVAFDTADVSFPASPRVSRKFSRTRESLFVLADLAGVLTVSALVMAVSDASLHLPGLTSAHLEVVFLFSALVVLLADTFNLYSPSRSCSLREEIVAVGKTAVMASLILGAALLIGSHSVPVRFMAGSSVSAALTMVGWRSIRRWSVKRAAADGMTCHNLLIVGTDRAARSVQHYLEQHRELGFIPLGLVATHKEKASSDVVGVLDDLRALCRSNFVDEIIVCTHDRDTVKRVLQETAGCDVGVRVVPHIYDELTYGPHIDQIGDFPLMVVSQRNVPVAELRLKRLFDVFCGSVLLIFLFWIFVAIAILIRIDSPGSVFYASRRVGRRGRIFNCYKFRTMVSNAEQMKARLQHLNERDDVLFKITNDPRITRVGRYLRKYSLDELPQLWNVLIGDMSLVGPRPPLVSEVSQYQLQYLRRLEVLPGITGLWQVQARKNPSFEQYIALDLQYVENWSFLNDMTILFRTIGVVFAGTGQ